MKYRPEIDGLRAIAVLPVIFFHSGLKLFKGGFIGVDIFFVISGYLITSIIITQIFENKFSLLKFYERRARRILPPLIITVLTTFILGLFFLVPGQIKNVGQSLISISLFFSNYFFYLETDYFNYFNEVTPLLHIWSLSLEEQFYIIFPVFLYVMVIGLKKVTRDTISILIYTSIIILVLAAFSLNSAIDLGVKNKALSFYAIQSRGWELMIGSLIALFEKAFPKIFSYFGKSFWRNFLLGISLLMLITSFIIFDKNTLHPGYFTLIPVLGTSIIILVSGGDDVISRIFKNNTLVEIGLISYALYLFHNPIFSYINIFFDNSLSLATSIKLVSIVPIYYFSKISLKYIENPFRKGGNFSSIEIFTFSVFSLSLIFGLGLLAHKTNGFEKQFIKLYNSFGMELLIQEEEELELIKKHHEQFQNRNSNYNESIASKKVLILGDSFAQDVYFSLCTLNPNYFQFRLLRLDDECMKNITSFKDYEELELCTKINNTNILIESADIFIISNKWQESTFDDGYRVAQSIRKDLNKTVYVLGSILFARLSSISIKMFLFGYSYDDLPQIMYENQRWDRKRISDKLKDLVLQSEDEKLRWIEKSEFFNDYETKTSNLFYEDGKPKIWDNAHLTSRTYLDFGNFIFQKIMIP